MGQAFEDDNIRKLWPSDLDRFREHLLRLDPASRSSRFAMNVSDAFLERYAETSLGPSAQAQGIVVFGHFSAGGLRGAAELRPVSRREAEAAFSVEPVCRGRGIGTALFSRLIVSARNRKMKRLYMSCLVHNRAMQALASKFEAQLVFEAADVLGIVDHDGPTPATLMDEALADAKGYATAIIDLQKRWFNLLPRRLSPPG
jgi:RimJ/RimL family protein N-acetyltransferase